MKTCKNCENFYDGGAHFHCNALNTRCEANENPDMGTKLPRCDFKEIKKPKKEIKDEL